MHYIPYMLKYLPKKFDEYHNSKNITEEQIHEAQMILKEILDLEDQGYLNSYTDKDNKIVTYVKVIDLSNNPEDIINGRKGPYIRYDEDGVMVWNGKRCEADPLSEDDPEYLEMVEMLKEYE